MTSKTPVRCAIYTRKSSEEGLDQAFNSLHAQREACEAYIESQKSAGWTILSRTYDDGGISGGHTDRDALQALLGDIDAGKVNMVVVYKIDRLTRSLADFSRLVETFEKAGVSFVSVTQQFNTSTSMGRLTLNVLLSFAQFEREVTAERIRDKIAASKKKGMWMGGLPPLGYDCADRKLVINQPEAETVRTLYRLYLKCGSVRALKEQADRRRLTSKRRTFKSGRVCGGTAFSRGALYHILSNPTYLGRICHKDETYVGLHEPIITASLWSAVQTWLAKGAVRKGAGNSLEQKSPLAGKLFDETGDRLTPSHSNKAGRRYRYYISSRLTKGETRDDGKTWRLPAGEIESLIADAIRGHLIGGLERSESASLEEHLSFTDMSKELADADQNSLLDLVATASLRGRNWLVELDSSKLALLPFHGLLRASHRVEIPFKRRRKGVETKLITQSRKSHVDNRLIDKISKSHRYWSAICSGRSIADIARAEGVTPNWISEVVNLAFLAPDITEACLTGRHPPELGATAIVLGRVPMDWNDQRRQLGFSSTKV